MILYVRVILSVRMDSHNPFYEYCQLKINPYILYNQGNNTIKILDMGEACRQWCRDRGLEQCTKALNGNLIQYVKQEKMYRLTRRIYQFVSKEAQTVEVNAAAIKETIMQSVDDKLAEANRELRESYTEELKQLKDMSQEFPIPAWFTLTDVRHEVEALKLQVATLEKSVAYLSHVIDLMS